MIIKFAGVSGTTTTSAAASAAAQAEEEIPALDFLSDNDSDFDQISRTKYYFSS